MQEDYYQNILYPLQDKVLEIVGSLPVEFYLTGGTALSRAYLHHRHSDDLDFFLNRAQDFKQQVNEVTRAFSSSSQQFEVANTDENYARIFITGPDCTLKLDFVNDVAFRRGLPVKTSIFIRTDTILNILSNKLSALSRYATKDLVDIVFISENTPFTWEEIFDDASQKDLWVNPVNIAEILEKFPVQKLQEIAWAGQIPSDEWFMSRVNRIIPDILDGGSNSLFKA